MEISNETQKPFKFCLNIKSQLLINMDDIEVK